jgi:hypothetical protein
LSSYPDGHVHALRDAYAFAPTLGDIDLHLAGKARHEKIYERLGAHVREIDGALRTSVAGATGIWEMCFPDGEWVELRKAM